jgi:hypothetical protein
MPGMTFTDKFIGYIDILGFKALVEAAESGVGMPLDELLDLARTLGSPDQVKHFRERGSAICPGSPRMKRDLDFCVTQISDCAVVSSEVSPAGMIALVNHCWVAVMALLRRGVLCRGYITRGKIFHTDAQVLGSGYQRAYEREGNVAAFKHEADERGTPFVEIDGVVCDFVSACGDWCTQEMFARSVRSDGEVTALFPFKTLAHKFVIRGKGNGFDSMKERQANRNVRVHIGRLKDSVSALIDPSNLKAVKKAEHYLHALDAQLRVCDKTDELLDLLDSPASPETVAKLRTFIT